MSGKNWEGQNLAPCHAFNYITATAGCTPRHRLFEHEVLAGKGKGPAGQGGRVNYSLLFVSEGGGFGGRGFWNAKRVMVEAVRVTHRPSQRVREIRWKSDEGGFKRRRKELRKRHRRVLVPTSSSPSRPCAEAAGIVSCLGSRVLAVIVQKCDEERKGLFGTKY